MKILVSHPTGNQFVRAFIKALDEEDLLSEFHTTISVTNDTWWLKTIPANFRNEFLRRTYPVKQDHIHAHPLLELARFVLPKMGLKTFTKHETGRASVDGVYNDLDNKVARRLAAFSPETQPDAVYAYEDGAKHTFIQAKKLGINCFYDLPIGYWRAQRELLTAERERWPDWAVTLPAFKDSEQKLAKKDEELCLADKIFAASSFTRETLSYFPGQLSPVKVVPYGFPPVTAKISYFTNVSSSNPLKLIFVGGLTQRKGIADVFEAVKVFGNRVSLTVVGNKTGENCPVLNEALHKHRWIPSLPHENILKLMREHDVLLFPSLFEGFGMVITEAMAQGTPVITTERTCGPDIITHGENGWLVDAGSTQKLIEAIENILMTPAVIESVGKTAAQTALKRPWKVYADELINEIIGNN
jgi:glycosyltransferase involved in cell wall biosynthesis